MKRLILFLLFCVYLLNTNAQQVTLREAQTAATFALLGEYEANERSAVQNSLSIREVNTYSVRDTTFLYEVLFNNGEGVLLSGNKNCLPVLGYFDNTEKSVFDSDAPCCLTNFLNGYVYQIRESFVDTRGNLENLTKWNDLLSGNISHTRATVIVSPLTKSEWNQNKSNDGLDCEAYNYYVPNTSSYCTTCSSSKKCPPGCAAVAMAQVMYYWKYPMIYDWCNMEDELRTSSSNYTKERNNVAKLIYDAAKAGIMSDFCFGATCQTTAAPWLIDDGMRSFDYNTASDMVWKSSYTMTQWKNKLKTNLNNGRPVIYGSLTTTANAHCFVCDGYRSDDYFHFNWGWGGYKNDSWFTLDSLKVGGVNYSVSEYAVFDIYPSTYFDFCNYNLEVNSTVMASILLNMVYPTNLTVNFNQPTYNTINPGQNVTYKAHNSIIIKPGFRAAAGSNFRAHIEPCAKCPQSSPSPAPQNPNVYLENEDEHSNNIPNLSSSISVFPNPTTGIVNIISQNAKIESISVFDISGKVLENNTSFAGTTLDLSWLSNGIYFIKIKTLSEQVTHKVIIQK